MTTTRCLSSRELIKPESVTHVLRQKCHPCPGLHMGWAKRKGATTLMTPARRRPAFGPGNGPEVRPIRERVLGRISGPIGGPFRGSNEPSRN